MEPWEQLDQMLRMVERALTGPRCPLCRHRVDYEGELCGFCAECMEHSAEMILRNTEDNGEREDGSDAKTGA